MNIKNKIAAVFVIVTTAISKVLISTDNKVVEIEIEFK